ncbi:MAG: hypothetical protein WAV95_10810 [Azonexus sp.]
MKTFYTWSLAVLMAVSLTACGKGKPEKVKLGNGAFSVEVPPEVSFRCQILQHATDCGNYNIPNSNEGMEVRVCQGESKKTRFLTVTGKHPDDEPIGNDKNAHMGFAAGWSRCEDAKIARFEDTTVDGKKAQDAVLTTPLGDGATRVFVDNGYSVMVLAVPKRERSAEEISGFVNSFRPLNKN